MLRVHCFFGAQSKHDSTLHLCSVVKSLNRVLLSSGGGEVIGLFLVEIIGDFVRISVSMLFVEAFYRYRQGAYC
jgi:hypothetical protein